MAPLVNDLTEQLLGDEAIEEVRTAFSEQTRDEQKILAFLAREMRFYNQFVSERSAPIKADRQVIGVDTDEAIEDADTIKGSLKTNLNLKGWLKKLLDILNELLKLLRGVI